MHQREWERASESEEPGGGSGRGYPIVAEYPAHPARIAPLGFVRSTLLASALEMFRETGLLGRYAKLLAPDVRDEIFGLIAGTWVPVAIADAHYAACDEIGLSDPEAFDVGRTLGMRVQQIVLQAVVRMAETGSTPWSILSQYERFWKRLFEGGSFTIWRAGPKEAMIRLSDVPFIRFGYFRQSFAGVNQAVLDLVAPRSYTRVVAATKEPQVVLRLAWT